MSQVKPLMRFLESISDNILAYESARKWTSDPACPSSESHVAQFRFDRMHEKSVCAILTLWRVWKVSSSPSEDVIDRKVR